MPAHKILLLEALEDLSKYDFEKFRLFLNTKISDRWKPIPKSFLETDSCIEAVNLMVNHYGEESAVSLAVEILKLVNNNKALWLENARRGGETHAVSTSSSAVAAGPAPAAAAAPAAISAQGGSVVFAPTLMGGTSGPWNVTINK